MRKFFSGVLLLSVCACRDAAGPPVAFVDKPPLATVRMLEARLARDPCIGALDRWFRRYHYRAPGGRLDKHEIVIDLEEAGDAGGAGVSIEPVYARFDVDDRPIKTAFGIYDDRLKVIRHWRCGSNLAGDRSPRRDLPTRALAR